MTNITINYKKNTIEISKSFAKSASAYGTQDYYALVEAKKEFPNFRLVVKTSKSNNTFKGMDFNFMREYISKHDNADEMMESFTKLCDSKLSYGEIKAWFIAHYPVFHDCKTRADWILAA